MALDGEYEPNAWDWVADHVARYEASGGADGGTMKDRPCVVLTTKGARSGKTRKVPVMRVSDGERYAVVASLGGAPNNPVWANNLMTFPQDVRLQDGPRVLDCTAHLAEGAERATWWDRAVAAFPEYAEYQGKTDRVIPVFVLEPVAG
ncbi:nitroreductase family deazaflavin-dependent oxidoreductase [Saccharopolyspora sp. HNM0983]|uniref:Nitroreductase family deazaflavin-dependent oxidoreductase n=1 Tax=Saccharopolyspora montiporae TaxID=2781240 RepID=A0A929G087_9PSEU|nr:nitroreductase family deazaflavin-dependent oxidoreductase [Saccharopolyspora sp. HNM0983]